MLQCVTLRRVVAWRCVVMNCIELLCDLVMFFVMLYCDVLFCVVFQCVAWGCVRFVVFCRVAMCCVALYCGALLVLSCVALSCRVVNASFFYHYRCHCHCLCYCYYYCYFCIPLFNMPHLKLKKRDVFHLTRCHFLTFPSFLDVFSFTRSDINECITGAARCHYNATCVNTPGSFSCFCEPGYTGDGSDCNGKLFL